ncbi:hypothetical protein SKAU_G00184270 [Synaphobranchus kaupii]|uniref:Adhesion G protein-coupled receptor F5-like n=1 Tax=Synaphobranchus kaupii TaxID=118154 RepID=A0A9Q1FCQ8_SYNKA|nr:hypothetical protein SKAU_G00184270 [Synaphobranchus kaupii]
MVIRNAIDKDYRNEITDYVEVTDIRFSSGSVVVNYALRINQISSSEIETANQAVAETLGQNSIEAQNFTADLIENTFSGVALLFVGDSLTLRCEPRGIEGDVIWKVNEKDASTDNLYEIDNTRLRLSVERLITSDSGKYECSVRDGIVRFIRNQIITVMPEPTVTVQDQINSRCSIDIEVKCCAEPRGFPLVWTEKQSGTILDANEFTEDQSTCITVDRTCLQGRNQTLICTLTIEINFTEETSLRFFDDDVLFDCNEPPFGSGRENQIASIGCPGGSTFSRCEDGEWKFVNSTCLLPEIKELQIQSERLERNDVQVFVQRLLNVTDTFSNDVVISTANILSIVDTLNNVVDIINISGTVNLNETTNFLEILDILVGDVTGNTWAILNENMNTSNTSSNLLRSVEVIVPVIGNITSVTTSRIELKKDTFDGVFHDNLNSTVLINVSESMPRFETEITTVNFRTLRIVLSPLSNDNNLTTTINGAVVLVHTNSTDSTNGNINITLTFTINNTTLANPQCVFWNFTLFDETQRGWDSSGCEVQTDGNESVTCFCNHLTSFSILMSPSIPEAFRFILDFITYIGVGISLGSLVLCLIIEAIVWTAVTRNNISYMRHVTIVNIAVSLLIANIWFIIGAAISDIDQKTPVGPCSAATFFIHFFYLALFFWMLISGLLLFYHMVMVFSAMSKRKMMAIAFTVGYGAPLIIAAITVAVTAPQDGYFRRDNVCWLNWFETKALLAFVIPALAIVFINFIILIVVLYKLLRRGVGENQTDDRNAMMVIARCVALLTPFFGLTWGFGIGLLFSPESIGLHVVFAVLNSLQGFFVLVFGTLLDSRMRAALAGRFSFITSSNRTRTTSAGPSSSSGLDLFQRRRRAAYHVSEAVSSSQSNAASESFVNT